MQIKVATSGFREVDLPPAFVQDLVSQIEAVVRTAPAESALMRIAPDLTFSVRLADGEHVYELLAGGTVLRDPVTRQVWQFGPGRSILQSVLRSRRQRAAGTPRLFLSYSTSDHEWVSAFAEALRQHGLRVFDEDDVEPIISMDALATAVRDSDVLVTVVEEAMLNTPNLLFELGVALGTGKRVVSIIPRNLDLSALPVELQWGYLRRDSPQETAEELSRALAAA